MNCVSCKSKIQPGEKFCTACGEPVSGLVASRKCGSCSGDLESGAKFCTGCGARVESPVGGWECSSCGSSNEAASKFCTSCGAQETRAAAATVPMPEQVKVPVPQSAPAVSVAATRSSVESAPSPIVASTPEVRVEPAVEVDHSPPPSEGSAAGRKVVLTLVVLAALGAVYFFGFHKKAPSDPVEAVSIADRPKPASQVGAKSPSTSRVEASERQVRHTPSEFANLGQALVDANTVGNEQRFSELRDTAKIQVDPVAENAARANELNEAGLKALKSDDLGSSEIYFRQAVEASEDCIECLNNLGYVQQLQQRYEQSEATLIQVIGRNPSRSVAWANLAKTLSDLGKSAAARAAFIRGWRTSANRDRTLESYKRVMNRAAETPLAEDLAEVIRAIESERQGQ